MLFIMSLNFTDRGIREIKDDLKRAHAAQDLAKKCGCEIKQNLSYLRRMRCGADHRDSQRR